MSAALNQQGSVEALDAYFQERRGQVPVLAQRSEADGITAIRHYEDAIPLLFPHTTYKSYPETLIARGQWAQLNRWLDSLSTQRVVGVDVDGVVDVDHWIERLAAAGHFVSSSSGTSGKSSFLNATQRDRDVARMNLIDCIAENTGTAPQRVWHVIPVAPDTGVRRHNDLRDALLDTYARPDALLPGQGDPSPTGHHRYMGRLALMRRAMADGSATPDEIADFEAEAAARAEALERRLRELAAHVYERRHEQLLFTAMFPMFYRLTGMVEDLGASAGDFTGSNVLMSGGGLKGTALPADYRSQIFRMFNLEPSRFFHYYAMQEINVRLPKCLEGRYHTPSQVALFVLDKDGEVLAPVSDGQVEGRAAFVDMTVDGRWGGTISGDKILADLGTCPCGRPGPTVFEEISRYSDLPDGDKITCAGTVDAYVRGFIEE